MAKGWATGWCGQTHQNPEQCRVALRVATCHRVHIRAHQAAGADPQRDDSFVGTGTCAGICPRQNTGGLIAMTCCAGCLPRSAIALLKEARRTREQQRQVAAAAIATAAATAAAAGASGGIEDLLAELCSSSAAPVVPSSGATPYGKRGGAALHSPEALSYTERVYDSGGGGVVREPESSLPGTAERDHQEPLSVHGLTHQPQPRALGPGGGDNFGGGGAALAAQRTVSHGGGGGAAIHSWSGLVDVSAGPVRGAASGSASGGGGGGGNAIGGVPLIPVAPGGRAARAVELLSRARSNLGRANAGGSGPQPSGALSPV